MTNHHPKIGHQAGREGRTARHTSWARRIGSVLAFFAALMLASAAQAVDITGAGATFPAPLYATWADAYHKATNRKINYQSVGSSAGLRQIRARTVDFGASDMPLSDDALAKDGLIQFPTVMGGVVPVINLRGIKPGDLKLTGAVLGDIYLGRVKRWNDPAIASLNPGLALPDAPIVPIRRADGSGTTFVFTHYLSKVNPAWKEQVGTGAAVKWPLGAGGKGNEGVAAFVQRLPNSIGYVEYSFAKLIRMTHVKLQNRAGRFVDPDDVNFKAAAAGAAWDKTFFQVLTDQDGADAWPITAATFIMMHVKQDDPAKAAEVLRFFDWAFKSGDEMARRLEFVSLPDPVKALVRREWGRFVDGSGRGVPLP